MSKQISLPWKALPLDKHLSAHARLAHIRQMLRDAKRHSNRTARDIFNTALEGLDEPSNPALDSRLSRSTISARTTAIEGVYATLQKGVGEGKAANKIAKKVLNELWEYAVSLQEILHGLRKQV